MLKFRRRRPVIHYRSGLVGWRRGMGTGRHDRISAGVGPEKISAAGGAAHL